MALNLFGSVPILAARSEVSLRPVPPATKRERLAWEKELLGLYVSGHPLEQFREKLAGYPKTSNRELFAKLPKPVMSAW